jgi:hypothetical protein
LQINSYENLRGTLAVVSKQKAQVSLELSVIPTFDPKN